MNVGQFMFDITKSLMTVGQKLYDVFTTKVNISFIQNILKFFGAEYNLPESISLYWIITSAGATVILGLLIYRLFK